MEQDGADLTLEPPPSARTGALLGGGGQASGTVRNISGSWGRLDCPPRLSMDRWHVLTKPTVQG